MSGAMSGAISTFSQGLIFYNRSIVAYLVLDRGMMKGGVAPGIFFKFTNYLSILILFNIPYPRFCCWDCNFFTIYPMSPGFIRKKSA